MQSDLEKKDFTFVDGPPAVEEEKTGKQRGFFSDAVKRFASNKSSVVAACILALLVLFAVFAPAFTVYTMGDKESLYQNKRPILPAFANAGFWDGGRENEFTEENYAYLRAIGVETGLSPVLKVKKKYEKTQIIGSTSRVTTVYRLRVDSYKEVGVVNGLNLSKEEFASVVDYQNRTGRQVLYPLVQTEKLFGFDKSEGGGNYWYEIDRKGKPVLDANGEFRPLYLSVGEQGGLYAPYENGKRIDGDDGSFVYGRANQSGYSTRICFYEYYLYKNGFTPRYYFGTNTYGQDIFCALAHGARFSLLLALGVSALNLLIGAIYGAIEGYFGGKTDLVMERIADVLSGVPFTVVVTLFGYHLAAKVGVIPSFLFAFLTTGWLSTAALTRKQFYRFKNREYIMAAKTLGAGHARIILRHIFPNSIGAIITSAAMLIPSVIGMETTLTYLGIVNLSGVGATSLGTLIELGKDCMELAPHVILFPSLFLALLLVCFNLFGNGLRDAFNPSLRGA